MALPLRLALLGEYTPAFPPHAATDAAIQHSCKDVGTGVHVDWIPTEAIDDSCLNLTPAFGWFPAAPTRMWRESCGRFVAPVNSEFRAWVRAEILTDSLGGSSA